MLQRICHSSWMAHTGVMIFMRSCMYELAIGGMHWRLSSMILHICHSSWVAYTRVMVVCSCAYAMGGTYWRLSSMLLHICHSSWVTYTRVMVVCSCMHVVGGICHLLWVACTGVIMQEKRLTKDEPWVLKASKVQLWVFLS